MKILSFLSLPSPANLTNHRAYCQRLGYEHVHFDASQMPPDWHYQALCKYQALLSLLENAAENELVAVVNHNVAFVSSFSIEEVMQGRDHLLMQLNDGLEVCTEFTVWRNTPDIRSHVRQVFANTKLQTKKVYFSETEFLSGLFVSPWNVPIGSCFALLPSKPNEDQIWGQHPTLAILLGPHLEVPEMPTKMAFNVSPQFRQILTAHINECISTHSNFLSFESTKIDAPTERETFNPHHPIALVTLYTANIATYGRIAERRLHDYCLKHGYTLHVHRDIPAEINLQGASGNWAKPWLLRGYLEHHEWVFWIDADVLVQDMNRPLEPLLEGRDHVVANDAGNWEMNAGIMGFRRTPKNLQLLEDLMRDFVQVTHKESVYASQGDQYHFIQRMKALQLFNDGQVMSFLDLNTPWWFRTDSSFMVHYFGIWTSIRALLMQAHANEKP